MKQKYKDINFKIETEWLIGQVDAIVAEYLAQGFRMTVRQIYYQCIARDIFPATWIDREYNLRKNLPPNTKNTVKNYKRLAGIINDGKLAGALDWDAIEDVTRDFERKSRWDSPSDALESLARQYHEDLWTTQDTRVFVIVEKDALLGVLRPTCRDLDLPLMAARGYASGTVLREFVLSDIAPTLNGIEDDESTMKDVVILHLGDHDPSGIDMTRDLQERIELFTWEDAASVRTLTIERIALNMDQIEELRPPENPAKTTDSRFEAYRKRFGDSSWELDALTPVYIDRLVRAAAGQYMNAKAFKKRRAEVAVGREKIIKAAKELE